MREANNIDDHLPTPILIQQTATKEAGFRLVKPDQTIFAAMEKEAV